MDGLRIQDNGNMSMPFTFNYTLPNTTEKSGVLDIGCTKQFNFILNTFIAGIICILGIFGNTISFVVLTKDKSAPVATYLLKVLAFIDNVFLCSWFLHFSITDAFTYHQLDSSFHISWLYVRVYTYPLLFIGQTGTIWLTVLIAASRYIAVCKPYHAAKYASFTMVHRGVMVILGFSVLYNMPRFFEAKFVAVPKMQNGTITGTKYQLAHTALGQNHLYQLIYFDIMYYIFSFVLPLLLLIYLNTQLTLAYRKIQQRRRALGTRQENNDHSITLVMIIVILVFIVCNAPGRIVQVIWRYQVHQCLTFKFIFNKISNVFEVLNSSTNFIIYCLFRKQFRHILHDMICGYNKDSSVECDSTRQPLKEAMTSAKTGHDDLDETVVTNV